ncbi:3255_t:CDS:2 [Rhizophagus irregularis]|nr:3255_t:CDS:2 [Rhizophagus irregularis]
MMGYVLYFQNSSREALDEVAVKGKGEVPPVGEDSLEAAGIGGGVSELLSDSLNVNEEYSKNN